MAAPRTARKTFNGREYFWKGETFPSVTTIIRGGIPSWALENWKLNQVAERAVDMAGDLAAMIERDRDATLKFLKEAPRKKRDQAAGLGTMVHETVEAIIMGAPAPRAPAGLPGEERVRIDQHVRQFLLFEAELKPKFRASEATIFNRSCRYAGTLDAIADIAGETWLIDVKTAASGVWPDAALQLAAYRAGEFVGLPDRETEQALPEVHRGGVLHLQADSWSLIPVECGPIIFDHFCAAYAVWRWNQRIAKQVVGGAYSSSEKPSSPIFAPRVIAGERK